MVHSLLRKRKVISAFASALLVATAFQPAGCTINIDEQLLQQLAGVFGGFMDGHGGPDDGFGGPMDDMCEGDSCNEEAGEHENEGPSEQP